MANNPFPWGDIGTLFGGNVLGGLLGSFGQGRQMNAFGNYVNNAISPNVLMSMYHQLLPGIMSSPAFAMQQRQALGGAAAGQTGIANQLAARGLSGSGMGIMATGVGNSLAGNYLGQANAGASAQALGLAQQMMGQRAQLYGQGLYAGMGPRNWWGQMGGSFLDSLGGILNSYYGRNNGMPH